MTTNNTYIHLSDGQINTSWTMIIDKLRKYFSLQGDSAALSIERYRTAQSQIPLMYLILNINMLSLCFTHLGKAPVALTHYAPIALLITSCIRVSIWVRRRNQTTSKGRARRALKTTLVVAVILSAFFVAWALSLFAYGDAQSKSHVVFFIGLTITTIITCLITIRQASTLLFATVVVPASIFLVSQSEMVYQAIAINMFLAIGAMVIVLNRADNHFQNSIEKQSELNLANNKIRKVANRDSLTGLPNRRRFFKSLAAKIKNHKKGVTALVLVDLDGFKPINDVFGHPAGDKVLSGVANRLSQILPNNSFLSRLGGDEFALILWGMAQNEVVETVQDILVHISEPIMLDEGSAAVSATAGIAFYPDVADNSERLFERADYALCFAKQEHKGEAIVFMPHHEEYIVQASKLAKYLREADFRTEFDVAYQPIWNLEKQAIKGFEALARWKSPKLGNVPPDQFIAAAEQAGLVSELSYVLIEKAIEDAKTWPNYIKLGINLSAIDVCSFETVSRILTLIETHQFDPKRITVEVTETAVMRDFERAVQSLLRLKEVGIQIALDDFGTGHSSLSCLKRLPLDHVKIDKSFIQNIKDDPQELEVTATIIRLCEIHGIKCVAEGIESALQMEALLRINCRVMQGYHFARPMPAEMVQKYISQSSKMHFECYG
jgi:diguanylate cyclase (GGDEF)-like protein